jgi:glycosyltransferase involved in cell wall biosynthesis
MDAQGLTNPRVQKDEVEATPLVSVLYPAFNDESYLAENIESIINQTYRNWELIIVNDASTDATPEILKRYQSAYPEQIKVIEQAHQNRFDAWDSLYAAAAGKYLCAIGADDVLLPEMLTRQVRLLEAQPTLAFSHSGIYRIDGEGRLINSQPVEDPPTKRQLIRLLESNYVWTPTVVMRKEAIEESGGWMRRKFLYAQDYDLWLRLLKGRVHGSIDEPLVKYRIHSWGLTQVAGTEKMLSYVNLVVQDKLKQWRLDEVFSSLDLDTDEGMLACYKEAEDMFFTGQFSYTNLELPLLNFLKPLIDKSTASRAVKRARTQFLYRVSYYFVRKRRYRLAIVYLKALARDPFFVAGFFRLALRRVRRRLPSFMREKLQAI